MRNPFDSTLIPDDYDLALLDRADDLEDLELIFSERTVLSTRYISPRGTGKSKLLDTFFTEEKRKELAAQHKLVYICRLSGDDMPTDAKIFVWLIEAVSQALENLDPESSECIRIKAEMQKLEEKNPGYDTDANKGEKLLKAMLQYLQRRRYSVTLILDEFHQLACAKHLADSTYGKMAALGQNKLISYIIASDYDDSVGSDTFYVSHFGRIFTGDPVHLKGVTTPAGQCALSALIRSRLTRCEGITFSDEELQTVYTLTAGIPEMVRCTLKELFKVKQIDSHPLTPERINDRALSACSELMGKWVQHFDYDCWESMNAVLTGVKETTISAILRNAKRDKRACLGEAGLYVKDSHTQEYQLICPLFAQYISREYPRHCLESAEEVSTAAVEVPVNPEQFRGGHITVINYGTVVTGDVQGDVNTTLNHGVSVSEILSLLEAGRDDPRELFASSLAERLRGRLPSGGIFRLPRGSYATEEAYEKAYDEAFAAYSQNLVEDVPVDENQKLMITTAQMETVEERFVQARSRYRSNLTDQMLAAQSERCQFYLKLSVIVEDALELPGLQMEDYSPQLVLYGKVLEQSLRDHFYPLFHQEQTLASYDTVEKKIDPDSSNTFGNTDPLRATIGGYECLIRKQKHHLATLCQTYAPQAPGGNAKWWATLQRDILKAREIRNLADHANPVSPTRGDLDRMCSYLLGTGDEIGILNKSLVGTELFEKLFSESISCETVL